MRFFISSLSLLMLFSFFMQGLAQEKILYQTVRGVVVDNVTGQPLSAAEVVVLDMKPQKGATTNSDGYFTIHQVPVGRHSFQISYMGYHPKVLNNLIVTSAKELALEIKLEQKIMSIDEIIVSSHYRKDKPKNDFTSVSARQFTVEETDKFAGSFGDISRMVINYAGVTAISNQRNDIIVRGNNPSGLLWRLEGVDIPNPNHYGELGTTGGAMTIVNNNVLSNSDFIIGAFPAEYGNALAGAFDLELRSGNRYKREYTIQSGYNGLEAGIEGPLLSDSSASYIVHYRYSTLAAARKFGIDMDIVPYYQDVIFKLNFQNFLSGLLSFYGIGGLSDITIKETEKDQEDWTYERAAQDVFVQSDMGTIGLNYNRAISANTLIQTNFAVAGSYYSTDLDSTHMDEPNTKYATKRNNFNETRLIISSKIISKLNVNNHIQSGISIKRFSNKYIDSVRTYDGSFRTQLDTKMQFNLYQAYVQWKHFFNDYFSISSGLHFQYFGYNDKNALEPRLGINWDLSNRQSVNFGFGYHSQLQNHFVYEIHTVTDNGNQIKTNKNLDFSKSRHLVIGYNYLLNRDLRIIIESYYQKLYDIPVKEDTPGFSMLNSGQNYSPYKEDYLLNKGTGKNYGLDITLERFFSDHYYFLTTLSLYDSKYKGFDKKERNTAYNGNFVFNCLGGYEFKAGINNLIGFDIKTLWAGGRRYIPVDIPASRTAGYAIYNWDNAYEKRRKNYFTLDLRIYYTMNRSSYNLELSADLQNITNHKNVFLKRFDPTSGNMKNEYQLGFIPSVKVKFEF